MWSFGGRVTEIKWTQNSEWKHTETRVDFASWRNGMTASVASTCRQRRSKWLEKGTQTKDYITLSVGFERGLDFILSTNNQGHPWELRNHHQRELRMVLCYVHSILFAICHLSLLFIGWVSQYGYWFQKQTLKFNR